MKTKISDSVNNSYTSILLHLVVTSLNYRKGLQENKRNSKAKFQRKKHRNVLLRDLCKDILHECEDKRGNFLLSFLFKCFYFVYQISAEQYFRVTQWVFNNFSQD